MSDNVEQKVQKQLDGLWTVETDSKGLVVQTGELPVWVRLESQQDESFIVTGYRKYESGSADDTSFLDWYGKAANIDTAAEAVVGLCNRWESEADQLLTEDDLETISVETVAEVVQDSDAVFAAVGEDELARGFFELKYHTPAGGDKSDVHNALREYDAVEIDGEPFPIRSGHVLHPEVHTHRRVPVYSDGYYAQDEVSVEEGINHVREFVETDASPTPVPTETVDIDNLVNQLVDAGASAIAVVPEISNEDRLTVKVWMTPSAGYETVGSYSTVEIDGQVLDLNWEFNCVDGPAMMNKVEVYVGNDINGAVPVSVDEGINNLREYVEAGCPRVVDR